MIQTYKTTISQVEPILGLIYEIFRRQTILKLSKQPKNCHGQRLFTKDVKKEFKQFH